MECTTILEVSSSYLSEIEKNKKRPGFNILQRLYDKYKINLNWLVANEGEMFSSGKEQDLLADIDFGDQNERFREMVYYMSQSPFFLSYMMSQFIKAFNDNKSTIRTDIEKSKEKE